MTPITAPLTEPKSAMIGRRPMVERPAAIRGARFLKKAMSRAFTIPS